MIKGLYSAASAMVAEVNQQQALAHNVANLQTPGFKQVMTSLQDFMHTSVMTQSTDDPPGDNVSYLGQLGLGVASSLDSTDFSQGGLQSTSNPTDVAIQGNGFFHVRTPNGDRYTRDGRFIRNTNGQLVTVDGYQVLGKGGQPITVPDGDLTINKDGTLLVNGASAGQLDVVAFKNPSAELTRDDDNTFRSAGAPTGLATGQTMGDVAQGYLEMSNANASQLMGQMVEITRAYQAAQQLVANQDELLGKTISSLGHIG
jgi:flagellar basal-body rod protein FlgF